MSFSFPLQFSLTDYLAYPALSYRNSAPLLHVIQGDYLLNYCIGTWNVRSMNQGKLEVVKQEMARVNVDILGKSELKWTGMGEFNSDDHYIYHRGQESLRRNGVAIMVNKKKV